jgi:hypothetical protein
VGDVDAVTSQQLDHEPAGGVVADASDGGHTRTELGEIDRRAGSRAGGRQPDLLDRHGSLPGRE